MVVYADILIVLNLVVDYFLLLATAKILNCKIKTFRIILGAGIGAIASLCIFLPQATAIIELLFKYLLCVIMVAVAFKYKNLKQLLKSSLVLLGVTCGYAGLMIAVWHIFKPYGMVINNSVVYFGISPVVLVTASVVSYLLFALLHKILGLSAKYAQKCEITVFAGGQRIDLSAILDTGNSVTDMFGKSEIIIADKSAAKRLFGETDTDINTNLKSRYRLVPCSTVSGEDVLEGFRCDRAVVKAEDKVIKLEKPILAVSKLPINDGYNAILNPQILN